MRRLENVIEELLEIIPKNEGTRFLIMQLLKLKSDLIYTAPELQGMRWDQCAEILSDNIPEINTDWKEQVRQKFAGII